MNPVQTLLQGMFDTEAGERREDPVRTGNRRAPRGKGEGSEPTSAPLSPWKAIVAMSENRAIGSKAGIPWHLPEDFQWFKRCTLGNIVVLGRKTFEGLPKALPGRTNFVLTREPEKLKKAHPETYADWKTSNAAVNHRKGMGQMTLAGLATPDVRLISSLEAIAGHRFPCDVFICGGGEIYRQTLPLCSELLLTRVHRVVDGDTFFPPFEHLFERTEILRETPDFTIERWTRLPTVNPPPAPPDSP